MELKRVVVTGMGTINPIGSNIPEFWNGLNSGVSGAATITRFNPEKFRTRFACEVKNFDPFLYFEKKEARKLDLFSQFAIIAADEAVKDASLDFNVINPKRAGIITGVGIGGLNTFTEEILSFGESNGNPKFSPFFIPKMIANIAGGHISIKYGLKGPNFTIVSACTSSAHALLDALNYIRLGKADIIVAGGAEAAICEAGVGGFNALRALSTRNDDPASASRPFDVDRDGFVLGEGSAMLVVEEYEHAVKRGAKIYAEFVGGGLNGDAFHVTAPHPEGEGAADVMQLAIEDAGLNADDINYINVHGTSTTLGDISEVKAIKRVFGEHAYDLSISSTKSMTGHLLGSAGAVEAIASIFAATKNIVPPTINHFNRDPALDPNLDYTFNKAKKKTIKYSMSNTFGFGGHNASIIFKKYSE